MKLKIQFLASFQVLNTHMALTAAEIEANSIFIITKISITRCGSRFMKSLFSSRFWVWRIFDFIVTFRVNSCKAYIDNIL